MWTILMLIVGAAVGFIFHPQIEEGLHRVARRIKQRRDHKDSGDY